MSNTFFAKGNHAFRNKKYQEALRNYLLAKKENPEFSTLVDTNIALIKRRAPNLLQQVTLLEEDVTPAIDYKNKTIGQVIKLAHEAMAQDDWGAAYRCWNSLLERTDETLSISILLRISKELFALDAFPEAEIALQRAEKCGSEHPGVLITRAQQYYYHCYSSWLMLVTENEPDWYKADGLDKRPDWRTACKLIERAEKVAPRNNLRRYVQAYLLLAEEAWDQQQSTQAREALGIALKAIGPNTLDKSLTQDIFAAVEQFRIGGNEQDPYQQALQEYLQALPLELLAVPDWLCLNDILNWNGLLLCGYVAREKAVDLAIAQGRTNPKHKEILKTALKAALDRGDTALADKFLNNLKAIHPDALDVRELDSCCELMKGNLDAFRAKWPHSLTPAQQRLRDYLKGKSVAVVGPAPTGTMDGEEIDSFDVVIRTNWRSKENSPDVTEFGRRVDITLLNAHSIRKLKIENNLMLVNKDIFVLCRRANFSLKNVYISVNAPFLFDKSLSGIQHIIFNVFLMGAERIKIFKADLYTRKTNYYLNYTSNINSDEYKKIRSFFVNHDIACQYNFMKFINASEMKFDFEFSSLHKFIGKINTNFLALKNPKFNLFLTKFDKRYKFKLSDLTIVIAVKDAEKTLEKTIRSIKTTLDMGASCVFVNDGSSDSTKKIMERAANHFSNCKVISFEKNIGVGRAKNYGLKHVETKLYAPLDGDDWIGSSYYTNLIQYFNKFRNIDYVRSCYVNCEGNNRSLIGVDSIIHETVINPREFIYPVNKKTIVDFGQIWAGVYSVDFIRKNNILFDEIRTAEDQLFCWKLALEGKRAVFSNEFNIYYRRGHSTALTRIGDDRQLDFIIACKNIISYIETNNFEFFLQKAIRKIFALICIHIDRSDTYETSVRKKLLVESKKILNYLPQKDLVEALKHLDRRRHRILKELLQ